MKSIEKRPTEKSLDEGEGATLLQQKEKTSWMKPELKSWLFKKRRLFIAVLKRRPRVVLALLGALIAGIAVLVGLQLVASASPYTAQDIGDLGDDSSGGAYGMNNSGQVVGYSYNASGRPHAFLYDSLNGMQDLGTLGGSDDYSYAYGINDFGQVVGYSQNTNGESHAFLWDREHGMQDLGTLDGGRGSNAFDINNSGQVVGYAFVDGQSRAVLWDQANGIQELGNLGGGYGHFDAYNEHAASINDSGQVVGQSHNASGQSHAFLWDQEHGMQDLGTLGGHIGSNAWDVNNSGQVVGKSYDNIGIERFFLWDQANGMQDLGTFGHDYSWFIGFIDINESGQLVTGYGTAILYSGGGVTDLNSLIPTDSGLNLYAARFINDSGQIVAYATSGADVLLSVSKPLDSPKITSPANRTFTTNTQPPISGTAKPGSTVTVYSDGAQLDDAVTADPNGDWSLTPSTALADGRHWITAKATDSDGNESYYSQGVRVTIDNVPPGAPTIDYPASGTTIDRYDGYFEGTAEANSTVMLKDENGQEVGTATAYAYYGDSKGYWSVDTTLTDGNHEGTHTITATVTDRAGNISASSEGVTVTVDTVAPDPPIITKPEDGTTTDSTTVSGTAEPSSTVTLYKKEQDCYWWGCYDYYGWLSTATADSLTGEWAIDTKLPNGVYTFAATASDEVYNGSGYSNTVTVTISVPPPPNDNFADAQEMRGSTVSVDGTTKAATRESGEPDHYTSNPFDADWWVGDHSVWYRWTAPASGSTTIDTCDSGTRLDSVLAVYTGSSLNNLNRVVDNNNDYCGGDWGAKVTFEAMEGTTYYIAVSDVGGLRENTFTLKLAVPSTDTTAPTTTATRSAEPNAEGWNKEAVTITLKAADEEGGSGVKDISYLSTGVHTEENTVTGDTAEIKITEEGTTTITYRASDNSNNLEDPNELTVKIDTTPPEETTIDPTSQPADPTNSTSASFKFSSSETGTSFQCKLDDGSFAACASPQSYTNLSEGNHTFEVRAIDEAGNEDGSPASYSWTVDTTPPSVPEIASPTDGDTTNGTPTFEGMGIDAGTTIMVYEGSTNLGAITADADGNWSITISSDDALSDGPHSIKITATDEAGNTSEVVELNIIVDAQAPDLPTITSPTDGSTTSGTPTFKGTAEAGDTITIREGDKELGTVKAAADGSWSFTVDSSSALTEGDHSIKITATDAVGNTSDAAELSITVDTTPPSAPKITSPTESSETNSIPTFEGTAETGTTITLRDGSTELGTATVAEDGSWSFTPSSALSEGSHSITATAADAVGNTSDTAAFSINVDATPPDAPSITSPADSATTNSTPTFEGTGEAGTTITLYIDGSTVGTTTVAADGSWSFAVGSALSDGPHSITATATDAVGNTSDLSAKLSITVDAKAPDPPTIASPSDSSTTNAKPTFKGTAEPGTTITLYDGSTELGTTTADGLGNWEFKVPANNSLSGGAHSIKVMATDAAGNTSDVAELSIIVDATPPGAPKITSPANDTTTNGTPTFKGTADSGTEVTIYDSEKKLGTTTAAPDGSWSFTPTSALSPDGPHSIKATATDAAGNVSGDPNPTVTITVDTVAPGVVIKAPENNSHITTKDFSVSGTAEEGSTVKISESGSELSDSPITATDGTWKIDLTGVGEGEHTYTVTVTDAAGNKSKEVTVTVTIDSVASDTTIDSKPVDSTNDTSASFSFSSTETDSSLECKLDDESFAACSSPMSYTGLDLGQHTFQVRAIDRVGNVDASPASYTWKIGTTPPRDTTPPDAPTITSPTDGSYNNTGNIGFKGTAEADSTVELFDGPDSKGTGQTDASGSWSVQLTAVPEGSHTYTARATDAASNTSKPSGTVTVTVDATAPIITLPTGGIAAEATDPGGAEVNYADRVSARDGVAGTVVADCKPLSGSTFPLETTEVECSATDAAKNTANGSFNVTVKDTTAPTISGMPSDITKVATSASGEKVSYTSPTATDVVDGKVGVNCKPASGSTFGLGETTVTCTASDSRNNMASKTFKVKVLYDFKGFFSPVDNPNVLNKAKAGSAIPVKFGLGGDMGLDIFYKGDKDAQDNAISYPTSQRITCASQALLDDIEQTVTAGSSSLSFDASTSRYHYVWKTDKAWAGACRKLTLKLKDGTVHEAYFKFT